MNISQLITRIKLDCGIYAIALPFENVDEVILDTIRTTTLQTFSTYCPHYETFRWHLNDLEQLEKTGIYEVYLLPDIFNEQKIMFVKDVNYSESDITGIGYWGGGAPLLQGNMLRQAMLSNAGLNLTNKIVPKVTFKFEHPRKITLYNVISSAHFTFQIALSHDKNFTTITPTMEESFFELANLDIQNMLYKTMKHYTDISSAYGNINLKLEEWQNAKSEREQLVNQWKANYHMDVIPFVYG